MGPRESVPPRSQKRTLSEQCSLPITSTSSSPLGVYARDPSIASVPTTTTKTTRGPYQPILPDNTKPANDYTKASSVTRHNGAPDSPGTGRHRGRAGSDALLNSSAAAMAADYQPLIQDTRKFANEYVQIDPKARVQAGGLDPVTTTTTTSGSGERVKTGIGAAATAVPGPSAGSNVKSRPTFSHCGGGGEGVKAGISPGSNVKSKLVFSDSIIQDKDDILEELLAEEEFSNCEVEICRFALEQQNFDLERAKEEIRVQNLLSMLLPHIREEDCRRALLHCQQKTNRAAAWLMQRSEELQKRAQ